MNRVQAFNMFTGVLEALEVVYETNEKNPFEINIPMPLDIIHNPKDNEIFEMTENEIIEAAGTSKGAVWSDECCIKVNFELFDEDDNPSWLAVTEQYDEEEEEEEMSCAETSSIGGQMIKKMIEAYTKNQ